MFDPKVRRIGFACKIQSSVGVADPKLNIKSTTLAYLNRLTKQKAVDKLLDLAKHNLSVLAKQLEFVSRLPKNQHMMRLSSDILPAYSHQDWMWVYFEKDMTTLLEREFAKIGKFARDNDIRLSFHPGQFCVLASERCETVEQSISEFEYHCDIIRYMGFGVEFQDFKCNVHIGGKLGPQGIKQVLPQLSKVARNTITIENQEYTWGLDKILELENDCALVLDIHHHWINTGEYIEASNPKLERIRNSWRGVRPTIHYSVSREEVVADHPTGIRPCLSDFKAVGVPSTKLRAHSDFYWNEACNQWALTHHEWADIMCESKEKNLASEQFAKLLTP